MANLGAGSIWWSVGISRDSLRKTESEAVGIGKRLEAALNIGSGGAGAKAFAEIATEARAATTVLRTYEGAAKAATTATTQQVTATRQSAQATKDSVASSRAVSAETTTLRAGIKSLGNETAAYRNIVESTDVSNREAAQTFTRLRDSALEMAKGLEVGSREHREIAAVAGTAARSLKTLDDQQTRLGFSGNTVVGVSASMRRGFGDLGNAVGPLVGAAGIGGLIKVTAGFVGEAQRAESAAVIFDKAIARTGQSATEADALVAELSGTFGVLPSVVETAAAPILRAGGTVEDVGNALRGAGASAAAGGRDIANAMTNIGAAVATGRSELTESADIMVNSSDAYKDYAENIGVSVDALTEQQKVQAFSNAIAEETRYELEDLTSVLTPQVKAQQEFRTSMAEARQELGGAFAPALATGATLVAGLVGEFTALPDATQASVTGVGGVTVGVAALATGLTALRPLLAATFLPPSGFIVAGAVAAITLGTALVTLKNNTSNYGDEIEALGPALEANAQGFATAKTAIEELSTVTDKDGFLGVVETLASTLDEKAGSALTAFANSTALPLIAQGELQKALDLTLEKFGTFETEAARSGIQASQQAMELSRNRIVLLEREIGYLEDLASGEYASAGVPFTAADALALENYNTQLVEVKTQYQASQVAANGYRSQLETVQSAQSALNDTSLTAEERMAAFAEALGLAADFSVGTADSLTDTGGAGNDAADGLSETGTAAEETGTALRSAADDAIAYADAISGVGAADFNPNFRQGLTDEEAALRAATRAQEEYQTSRVEGERQASEARAESTRTLADADAAERRVFAERRVRQQAELVANEALAQAVAYYAREVESSITPLEAQIAANQANVDVTRDVIQADQEWTERLQQTGGSLQDATVEGDAYRTRLQEIAEESANAAVASMRLADAAQTVSDKFDPDGVDAFMRSLARGDIARSAGDAENTSDALAQLNKAGIVPTSYHLEVLNERFEGTGNASIDLADAFDFAVEQAGNLGEALGLAGEDLEAFESGLSAIGALATGDIFGFVTGVIGAITSAFSSAAEDARTYQEAVARHGQETVDQFQDDIASAKLGRPVIDETALGEYERYLDAIDQYGQSIADTFYTVGENGEYAFDEEGLDNYVTSLEQGADRIETVANNVEATLQTMTDGFADVRDAEASAAQAQLDANLDSQGGEHTMATILQEQTIALNEALATRQEALNRAAELEAAGQYELANRLRNAAQTEYDANVSQIEQNAANQAAAIGQGSQQSMQAIRDNTGASAAQWGAYYEADAAAQMEAQRWAAEQMRRQNAVINDARYAELIASGVPWQEAYRIRAAELGYAIDEASGYMLTADEQASLQQAEANATNAGTVTKSIYDGTTQQETALNGQNARLAVAGGNAYSGLTSALGTASAALLGQLAGNVTNEVAGIWGRGNALSAALTGSANYVAGAATKAGNFEKLASYNAAQAKLRQEAANTNALVKTHTDGANLQSKTAIAAGNLVAGNFVKGGKVSADGFFKSAKGQLNQIKLGTDGLDKTLVGGGNFIGKKAVAVENAKARNIVGAAKASVSALHKSFFAQASQATQGIQAVASALAGGKFSLPMVAIGNFAQAAFADVGTGGFASSPIAQAAFENVAQAAASQMGYGALPTPNLPKEGDAKGGSLSGGSGSGKGGGSGSGKGGRGGGGQSSIDDQIADLDERIKKEKNPKKKAALKKKRDQLAKEQKKNGGSKSGGSSKESYAPGSVGDIEQQISEIDKQIKGSKDKAAIRKLQAKRDQLEKKRDDLLGKEEKAKDPDPAKGSIAYYEKLLSEERQKYDKATTDAARAQSQERINILEREIKSRKDMAAADGGGRVTVDFGNAINLDKDVFATWINTFVVDGVEPMGRYIAALVTALGHKPPAFTVPKTGVPNVPNVRPDLKGLTGLRDALPKGAPVPVLPSGPDLAGGMHLEAAHLQMRAANIQLEAANASRNRVFSNVDKFRYR